VARDQGSTEEVMVEVEFDQQQMIAVEQIRAEGRHGTEDAEIVRNVFREFIQRARLGASDRRR
jgi:hypothetical protein